MPGGYGGIDESRAGAALGPAGAAVTAAVARVFATVTRADRLRQDRAGHLQRMDFQFGARFIDPRNNRVFGHRRMGELRSGARRRVGLLGVGAAADPHHLFGQGVVGLQVVIGDGPIDPIGPGDGAIDRELAEVVGAQSMEEAAHQIAGAAHHIAVPEVPARLTGGRRGPLAVCALFDDVLLVMETGGVDAAQAAGQLVFVEVGFAQPGAFFQHGDGDAQAGQLPRHGGAARAAADDTNRGFQMVRHTFGQMRKLGGAKSRQGEKSPKAVFRGFLRVRDP
ncbi:hypothetical protein MAIT1_00133 [Magnetofaba australis IT-1]|uniref:Uncharacterized protein n=1 Tax=Magnetofaba australis IT-1 TaxID=1434232 RepID=A0A1Y2K8C6_9PROT|nr:hypothetical protein MAIT1_00133 [Magnetofaba australis IT-1]